MTRRCAWCGQFVATTTEPITGPNNRGDILTQLVCPDCAPSWRWLIERNKESLRRNQ